MMQLLLRKKDIRRVFNAETIKVLGSPKKINIGLDVKNKILGIKAAENNPDIKEYDFVKKGDENYFAGCGYIFKDNEITVVFTDSNGKILKQDQVIGEL